MQTGIETGLDLSVVVLLAVLVIGFFVFVIRRKPDRTDGAEPSKRTTETYVGPPPTPNPPPEALEPFIIGSGEWGEKLTIDVRHRQQGCDASGAPTSETGVYDPNHELLSYWFEAEGPNRAKDTVQYAIFDRFGRRVDRKWLPPDYFEVYHRNRFDPSSPTEQEAVVYCFVGWTEDKPPYPMVANHGCRRPRGPTPEEIERRRQDRGDELGLMKILYKARDPKNQEDGNGVGVVIYSGPCT